MVIMELSCGPAFNKNMDVDNVQLKGEGINNE